MSQHSHRFEMMIESHAMCIDVYTISQTAHNEHVGAEPLQFHYEMFNEVLPIMRASSCSHNRDNALFIEVGRTLIKQR